MLKLALAIFSSFDLRRNVFARVKTLKSIERLSMEVLWLYK